jgi:hypothetical protein
MATLKFDPHNRKAGVEHRNKKRRSRWHRRNGRRILMLQVRYGDAMHTYAIVQERMGRNGHEQASRSSRNVKGGTADERPTETTNVDEGRNI